MANQEHLDILKQGVKIWNEWRRQHLDIQPDLINANLQRVNLGSADFHNVLFNGASLNYADLNHADLDSADLRDVIFNGAILNYARLVKSDLQGATLKYAKLIETDLSGADLSKANLTYADLSRADLHGAILHGTDLSRTMLNQTNLRRASLKDANLSYATLSGAILINADLRAAIFNGTDCIDADFSEADLSGANLSRAILVRTNLSGATLTSCYVHGISVWKVRLQGAKQYNLVITDEEEPTISVDNLEVAQFIYLLLNNPKIRDVIDTIAKQAVLILGRFTPERKAILEALRNALRTKNYLPIVFDLEKPANRDITETVTTLAHLSRFIIADLTDPRSIPQELAFIIPHLPSVPVQPLLLNSQHEYGMFEHFTRFPWVLPVYRYADEGSLLKSLQEKVIAPAEQKAKELAQR